MNLRNEVELVMEYNIRARTRVDHLDWAPCATSTPIRKPLNSLSNFEPVLSHKKYDILPGYSNLKTTAGEADEANNYYMNSTKKTIKRNKIRSRRRFHRSDCDEDDEDDLEDHSDNNEKKKGLIIKIGSNKCINKRSDCKNGNVTNMESHAILSTCEDEQMENIVKKEENDDKSTVNCKSNQNYLQSKIVVPSEISKVTEHTKCPNIRDHSDSEKITVQNDIIINNPVIDNDLLKPSEFSQIQSQDIVRLDDTNHVKRKNRSPSRKDVTAKKLKDKQRLDCVLQCTPCQNKNNTLENVDIIKNIGRKLSNEIKDHSIASLTSHKIFSDSKEREWQDSLDLTASDIETSPDKVKLKSFYTHKNKKNSNSKLKSKCVIENNVHLDKEHPEKVRPKRMKKPPQNSEESELENPEIIEVNQIKGNSTCQTLSLKVTKESGNKYVNVGKNGFTHNSSNDFVKDILGMEFNRNCTGDGKEAFSYAFGWQFSSFKCCALKIGLKNEASGRTKHENSHFGGVLLKGKLLMTINGNEMKLKPGNMFCVPPLTDWKAINVSRTICLLYYWCGRF